MVAPARTLTGSWKGIRGDGHPGAKAIVTRPAASGSAALAAETHMINPAIASRLARTDRKGRPYRVITTHVAGASPGVVALT
jgi:hypothetical protein